ncbi:MAG: transglutaminase family protein [Ferrovum myxofaciens]|uniref:transglutaminase family protein n=1 Tax=Ferrovum myxofaciens TaxID=416213 RepID=UPI00235542BD|nr:transglutaminase family protein [Ferrovum myxofaciens]QKE41897.1 MAG: transglutaminase family protein [Ferrovum myxofaciens]
MTIRIALNHQTHYNFDRAVNLWPHEIRLRPAVHSRTPILSYSLNVEPAGHFLNWQQDPFGNWVARLVFPEKAESLKITVDLVADMTVINPFDFFMDETAENYPFEYSDGLKRELGPYLEADSAPPLFTDWLAQTRSELLSKPLRTIDMLVAVNQRVKEEVGYIVRLEAGVQTPEQTLTFKFGSCRDSAWLLVQALRHLGLAARFASGYLIQLKADVAALDGPSGTDHDFTDLHAWTEVYIPGAGWIGLDPTSGLLAGEGHIPLACTAIPSSAAPVTGVTEVCESRFDFAMSVIRIHEDPRVTKPYTEAQWQAILDLGHQVDIELNKHDVRLTMGGEPTFVSIDDMEGPEWNYTALSDKKRELSGKLLNRLQGHFAPGAMLHFGQGKWYPGEPLPRWALGCYWRLDGEPLWRDRTLLVTADCVGAQQTKDAQNFMQHLARELELDERFVITAFEDVIQIITQEQCWPENLDPLKSDLTKTDERRRQAKLIERGLGEPAGYVLPLKALPAKTAQRTAKALVSAGFRSSPWPLRREHLYLTAGDSPLGLRLPLASLPWIAEKEEEFGRDPFDATSETPDVKSTSKKTKVSKASSPEDNNDPHEIIHTALCAEVRTGVLCVFLPPVPLLEDFLVLITAIENTAAALKLPLRLEGYTPPVDPRIREFRITPDPGVIEVNIHPSANWSQLVKNTETLYEEARLCRLGTEKFMLDGRHTGTGGGNHVTLGAAMPVDSPCLRRPDVLMSLITYWQHHPALSYLFSGLFIGPTSQAPRVDEARHESLYELEIAFQQMAEHLKPGEESTQPWLVDRLLRNLLVDLSGNTHRAEFCIDKLYSPDSPTGRLGLVEFRGFEMPPHAQMSLLQMLLLRALVARFWQVPYKGNLNRWGTELHDRYMMPHFVAEDMKDVVLDLRCSGYAFDFDWFAPFLEFRFPRFGTVVHQNIEIELRQAIEPWHVLGEEVAAGGTARYVDSSLERMQVKVRFMNDNRHVLACNGRPLPLTCTGTRGEYVAAVRYRAWAPPSGLHPTIGVQAPLVFDLVDTWSGRSIGGCTYHVIHPGGRNYDTFPVNANEAEARRVARFWSHGHTPGPMHVRREGRSPDYPLTLDLRRAPEQVMESIPGKLMQQQ